MRKADLARSFLTFGNFFAVVRYLRIYCKIHYLAEDAKKNIFSLEKLYTQLKRTEQKILFGFTLDLSQETALGRLQKHNFTNDEIRYLFIGKRIDRNGRLREPRLGELQLISIVALQFILIATFLLGLSLDLMSTDSNLYIKLATIAFLLTVFFAQLTIQYELLILPFLVFMKNKLRLEKLLMDSL